MTIVTDNRLSVAQDAGPASSEAGLDARASDFFALLKPRVMSLVVFTGLAGIVLAPGDIHPIIGFAALLCIAVGAGASGALNMWYDADIDARMSRTQSRPIPMGRLTPDDALAFGLVLSVASVLSMGLLVNVLSAALLAFTIFFYVVVYTMYLKRRTPQNIVIGGLSGALPPVIGWAAVTGTVTIESLALCALIFFWTPPHFWALSLVKAKDYGAVGVPMMPNVAGPESTRRQILAYAVLLAPLGVAPALLGFAGMTYGIAAAALGLVFVALAVRLHRVRTDRAAMQLFGFSILYLFLLFALLLVERLAGLA
ncbi:heme o synthase [Zavarzinia marina]|uniref:heme o synthase n=1 Tax=Zavarzinia marina TaxID=2911065 RepID=UPI002E32CD20|nr:heme o synthase [Zavarzinia marina]